MQAMLLESPGRNLVECSLPNPVPAPHELLLEVRACGVCRTDLHIFDSELLEPKLPLILGHEIVAKVIGMGAAVKNFKIGDRVGVPWLGGVCGSCTYCLQGRENLCEKALFTGYGRNGGYCSLTVADAGFCFPIPPEYSDAEAAPLLCAGLIGWRCLKMTGEARRIGLYGFGAAAHVIIQVAKHQGREILAFTKYGDKQGQDFARSLGASWAGGSDEAPPEPLDAAIIFAPVGALVPQALKAVDKGGIVVCGGIHMSDIPQFPYELLWGERQIRSVANLTRQDAIEFLEVASRVSIKTTVQLFALDQANAALAMLKEGKIHGAAVLVPSQLK